MKPAELLTAQFCKHNSMPAHLEVISTVQWSLQYFDFGPKTNDTHSKKNFKMNVKYTEIINS